MKEVAAIRDEFIKTRLKEDTTSSFEADKDPFDEVMNKFISNNKRNYDFLIKTYQDYKDVVFLVCRIFIQR